MPAQARVASLFSEQVNHGHRRCFRCAGVFLQPGIQAAGAHGHHGANRFHLYGHAAHPRHVRTPRAEHEAGNLPENLPR